MMDGRPLFSQGATVVMMTTTGLVLLLLAILLIAVGDALTFGLVVAFGLVLEGIMGQCLFGKRALWAGIAAGWVVLAFSLVMALW